jgi:hypothetical protein
MSRNCFFYVVDQEGYIPEVIESCLSVHRFSSEDVFLFIPGTLKAEPPINLEIVEFNSRLLWSMSWYFNFVKIMPSIIDTLIGFGYDRGVYLDCDTYVCNPINDLLTILDKFDFVGAHSPRRYMEATRRMVPDTFPEFNIGVNPMRLTGKVADFWRFAAGLYAENYEEFGNDDQNALRVAMWKYAGGFDFRFHTLPPEYNFRFYMPCFASGQIKILHGRSDDLEGIARIANEEGGMRAWPDGISLNSLASEPLETKGETSRLLKAI